MTDSGTGSGLFSMPSLQYNEDGWGPYEISETFRDMPYQVKEKKNQIDADCNE